jgi:predicted RNase H-like HicB family nuclease
MEPLSEVLVIVHPEGGMDRRGAGYWTEVVDLPVCFEQAAGMEEASPAPDVKIIIEYAF